MSWKSFGVVAAIGFAAMTVGRDIQQWDQIDQLKADRATTQHQLSDVQGQLTQVKNAYGQLRLDMLAATSASPTGWANPCTLHDIYVKSPGC